MQFSDLGLIEPVQRAVSEAGYTVPSPIQQQAIPPVLAGRDLLGCAQTGTGKTAAFALPILCRLAQSKPRREGRSTRCLVLAPTRELAAQVADSFRTYGRNLPFAVTSIFGGVGMRPQIDALRKGTEIVVACPGRLLDLIGQGHARLDTVEVLVLDEADRMLDMGFLPDIRRIIERLPKVRQTLLFSATMPREIRDLACGLMKDPAEVSVAAVSSAADTVDQSVFHVPRTQKQALLNHLIADPRVERALVFTRTKHGADKVVRQLVRGGIVAEAIHGNKSQNARIRALEGFREGRIRVLVASDIAARGLDVDGITHVVNFDVPNEPETYVHRIGRTGRAGASGTAWSLCDGEERAFLADIERLMRRRVPVAPVPSFPALPFAPEPPRPPRPQGGFRGRGQGQGRGRPDSRPPQRSGHSQPGRRDHGHGQAPRRDHGQPPSRGGVQW